MPTLVLNLETLKSLDLGSVDAAFRRCLERAVRDCLDRPDDERARKVTLQLNLVPVKQIIQNVISCEGARGTVQFRCRVPDYETRTLDFGVRENGSLYFSEECPDNHRQSSLFTGDGDDQD